MFGIDDAIVGAVAGSAISGGLGFLGQSSANDSNRDIANQTSQANAAEAQKNRDWQEMMSNSSYQRAVKDMQAAGLNPMLAYSQGGASTPSGATGYAVQAAPMQNTLHTAANAINSLATNSADISSKSEQAKLMREQQAQTIVNTAKEASAIKVNEAQAANINADTILKAKQGDFYSAQTVAQKYLPSLYSSQAGGIEAQRAKDRALQPIFDTGGDIVRAIVSPSHTATSAGSHVQRNSVIDKVRSLFDSSSYNFGRSK